MRIDDLDRAIIDAFWDSPQATNKAVAQSLQVAENTIAARLRRLVANRVIKFTARVDMSARGFNLQGIVEICVARDAVSEVESALSRVEEINTIMRMASGPDFLAFIHARDLSDLVRTVDLHIHSLKTVTSTNILIVLGAHKHRIRLMAKLDD